jgi:hypothetical protein
MPPRLQASAFLLITVDESRDMILPKRRRVSFVLGKPGEANTPPMARLVRRRRYLPEYSGSVC